MFATKSTGKAENFRHWRNQKCQFTIKDLVLKLKSLKVSLIVENIKNIKQILSFESRHL